MKTHPMHLNRWASINLVRGATSSILACLALLALALLTATASAQKPEGQIVFSLPGQLLILDTVSGVRTEVPLPAGEFPSIGIASWCGSGDSIVFAGGHGGNSQVWTIRPDGSDLRRITDGSGDLVEPDPMPNCSGVVYHPVGGTSHYINFDGTGGLDLNVVLGHGRVGPYGRYVAGTDWATPTYNSSVYIYDLQTGQYRTVISPSGNNAFVRADWTADGTKLIVDHLDRSQNPATYDIWVVNLDGSNPTNVTADWPGSNENGPSITPNGAFILFTSDRDGSLDLWAMRLDGTGKTNLTQTPDINEYGPVSMRMFQPADTDGDGVPDTQDLCPDTATDAVVDATGCSIDQLVPCEGPSPGVRWKNHGAYVSAVAKVAKRFLSAGLITKWQAKEIVSNAARSHCGRRTR